MPFSLGVRRDTYGALPDDDFTSLASLAEERHRALSWLHEGPADWERVDVNT